MRVTLYSPMNGRSTRTTYPRTTLCPGEPTVAEIEASIDVDRRDKIALSRRLGPARAEFSVRYASRKGWPLNPHSLSVSQMNEIRCHPQYTSPYGCSPRRRIFALATPLAA